jgi:hypothetical protein
MWICHAISPNLSLWSDFDCVFDNLNYSNFEHIIIDGCSRDNTLDIIGELERYRVMYAYKVGELVYYKIRPPKREAPNVSISSSVSP